MKRCVHCPEVDPAMFAANRQHKDGLQSVCRSCTSKYDRVHYKKTKAKRSAQKSEWERDKLKTDPTYKIRHNLRARLTSALRCGSIAGSAVRDLGCTIPELRTHLESQFKPGMSWDNYGDWHIDHKKPLAKFDLTDREQFLEVCHYTNLQPLWAEENLSKGAK